MTRYTFYLFLLVLIGFYSCAHQSTETDSINISDKSIEVTVVKFDKALKYNDKGVSDKPSFVTIPDPFSVFHFYFRLPFSARTQIDFCTDKGRVLSKIFDKTLDAGMYNVTLFKCDVDAGHYVMKLIVDGKLVGTRKLSIIN